MPEVADYDSLKKLSNEEIESMTNVDGRAELVAEQYPVYLVSESTIDRCIPPSLKRGINPECLREIVYVLERRISERPIGSVSEIEELFSRCSREYWTIALAAFLPRGCHECGIDGPSIILSPERVEKVAKEIAQAHKLKEEKLFKNLLNVVYAHELGHAYTYTFTKAQKNYSSFAIRALEETFAQLFAYQSVVHNRCIHSFAREEAMILLTRRQSAEYRAWYPLVLTYPAKELSVLAAEIQTRKIIEIYGLLEQKTIKVKPSWIIPDYPSVLHRLVFWATRYPPRKMRDLIYLLAEEITHRYLYYPKLIPLPSDPLAVLPILWLLYMIIEKVISQAKDIEGFVTISGEDLITLAGTTLTLIGAYANPAP